MNLWPNGSPVNPVITDASAISFIRVAGGQVTIFDQNGNPLPVAMPSANIPTNWPLNLLGSNPGPSILSSLVVPNIQARATALNATLTLASNPATASLAVPLTKGGTAAWSYFQSGSNWVAQQATIPVSTANLAASLTMQFANVSWNDNSTNDAARAALGSTTQPPPAATTGTPSALPAPPADPAWAAGASVISSASCGNTNAYSLGGAQNIVLQHGIWSSGCTWMRMANWLNQDFLIANEVIPSLNSNAAIDGSQGPALISEINLVGGSNYILIGHSQGGLVSRWAAQQFQVSSPLTVKGVVTVDTPHEGANLTLNSPLFVSALLDNEAVNMWEYDGCVTPYDDWGCFLSALMFSAGTAIEPTLAAGVGSISWSQLQPGSAFLTNLNAQPETFKQAAVVGLTPQRFAFTRLVANLFGCNPEDACGERAIASDTEYFYDGLFASFLFWEFEAWIDCSNGDQSDCNDDLEAVQFFAGFMSLLDEVDAFYDAFIDFPGDGSSDAIVQGPSQYYPYATAIQYVINPADSHTGALKSTYVHSALDAALALAPFNVPTPASCSFGVSGSPYSESGGGGTGSFTVSALAGCQWSAVSEAPWISITSGVNGTSSGTVDFSVAANPVTIPRSGMVQVGNGTSSEQFTVNQGGACTYTLSEGPEVAAPAAGTSSTVQVTAPLDCPWSAVSNASWLTMTAGASGTGSGSFTWTVTPNTGSSDRTGTITVMSQILTVVDGISVGTPGRGTVTFSGSPKFHSYNPCAPSHCSAEAYENGTVSITVAGEAFAASYGSSSDSAASLASALVSQINYPMSFLSASASGATITITSTLDGAGTDYSLVTSATFQPDCPSGVQCFSGPAFTAAASGPNLTGGTN